MPPIEKTNPGSSAYYYSQTPIFKHNYTVTATFMKIIKAFITLGLTAVLVWALQTQFGPIPPLGKFLNPVTGFWQNAENKRIISQRELKLPRLQDEVTIKYDEHRVPHIFAKNEHDLYYAQGYVTATDRLWQMDIQTRSASGRLAEVVGAKALETDRYHRRMGMVYGAENSLRAMMQDPKTRQAIEAYTDGINAYVHNLDVRDYPIEYKLLNYKPEEWKPINCAFLLKLMSETLSGGSDEFLMTNTLNKFGTAVTQDLFPDHNFQEDPIIPKGTPWNFKPLPVPTVSASFKAQMAANGKPTGKVEGIGSNNWAVAGSKTASGYPILANDPHLRLSFPSIWYQIQLSAPGINVYGVSLPGAPMIIIGYNDKISWGVTNTDADVLDWYQIKFKDANKNQYWHNNQWNNVSHRTEVINVRGEQPVTEKVIYTHYGPVVFEDSVSKKSNPNLPAGAALRWIAHDGSNDLKTFYLLNRSKNYTDYRKALTFYTAPAQNFIFASAGKDIAITPNGKFPLKFADQGKFILDGTDKANDWQGWIPAEQNPTVKNPPRGFVSSANQSLTDKTYPYYINWQFGPYQRGTRINTRLAAMNRITVDSMRLLQTDNYSITARDILPTLIAQIDTSKLDRNQLKALDILKQWDKRYDANSIGASIFDAWWRKVYNLTWKDEFGDEQANLQWPSRDRTIKMLLTQPRAKWFDDSNTPGVETAEDIVSAAFNQSVNELSVKHGRPGLGWQWGKIGPTSIDHLAALKGFGTGNFESGGSSNIVNAIHEGAGPSWRMVVQMGPSVKGYGVFPGGESGNPGSFYYTDMLQTWKEGQLNELLYLRSAEEKSERIKSVTILKKSDKK